MRQLIRRVTTYLIWKSLMRQTLPLQRVFARRLFTEWSGQKSEVLSKINRYAPRIEREASRHRSPKKDLKAADRVRVLVSLLLFDKDSWAKRFAKRFRGLFNVATLQSGEQALAALDVGVSFDENDPLFEAMVRRQTFQFANDVNKGTLKRLTPKLRKVIETGGTVQDMRLAVQEVFKGTVRALPYRARMIAQTEMIAAANGGRFVAYQQVGVERKRWVHSHDKRVRDTHRLAGSVPSIPVDQKFPYVNMLYPGDPEGDVAERVNCRCILVPVTRG